MMKFEEAHYSLQAVYYGDHPEVEQALVTAYMSLPPVVQEFVLSETRILSVGRQAFGQTFPSRIVHDRPWLVVLFEGVESDELPALIAHEIAHAWLGHDGWRGVSDAASFRQIETAAADQAKAWGFTGPGTDEAFCARTDIDSANSR